LVRKNINIKNPKSLNEAPSIKKKNTNRKYQNDLEFSYEDIFDIHEIENIATKKGKYTKKLNNKCDFKFCNMDLCILGKTLILSGTLFQEKLAKLLDTEAEKINVIVDKFKNSPYENISVKDLLELNKSIKDTLCCIADIEDKITTKIKIGENLLHEKDPCPPHCEQDGCSPSCDNKHEETNDDDDD
jgi:hypothetical protein